MLLIYARARFDGRVKVFSVPVKLHVSAPVIPVFTAAYEIDPTAETGKER